MSQHAEAFVHFLMGLPTTRRYDLRRGWRRRPLAALDTLPALQGWCRYQPLAHCIVAGLYAEHPCHEPGVPFVTCVRARIRDGDFDQILEATLERAATLLGRWTDRLPEDSGFDCVALLNDLSHWDDPRRFVQARWRRLHYRCPRSTPPSPAWSDKDRLEENHGQP